MLWTNLSGNYTDRLKNHYQDFFGIKGSRLDWDKGPVDKLHPDFYVMEFKPNKKHDFWIYSTVGMSLDRHDDNLIELFIYSPRQDKSIVELLTVCGSYHRNKLPLNLHHTVYIGRPWLDNSICDHGFISLPYLDGEDLEIFKIKDKIIHCYWLIPITEQERDYKISNGCEALEQLFEENQFDYLNPDRLNLIKEK